MPKLGRSPWLEEFPKSRVHAYPRQHGSRDVDVVIVGGGLTGCASAYALAAAGVKAMLLEAECIGHGSTASATGWIADDPGVAFADVEKAIGLRAARWAWRTWHRGALDFAALLRRLDVQCRLEPRGSMAVAMTPEQAERLKKDQRARRAAGLDAVLLNARAIRTETALDAAAGLRARDGATIDPYRACVGLAAAAEERGATLFEHSPVRRVRFGRRHADVLTAAGSIRTRHVVVATGAPTPVYHSLARHFWFHTRYFVLTGAVPAKTRQLLGRRSSIVRDWSNPAHVVRWVNDERMLVAGADGVAIPVRQRDKMVVQRTGQLMYELSTLYPDISGIQPAYGWCADYARTGDGLPYIGPHRNFPHHVFAFGDASHGVAGAYVASRIILRHCIGEPDPADDAFSFNR
jgi:glycine/D-amino acid oxidase-like deaminating enzyme